ncbi:hypothetical protein B0H14DRAFT_2556845 [Mycena olivaceomarginata]|nr:hypothetical protein B0H14DRAFT_2556845 [Mycena olivaceomarginata]
MISFVSVLTSLLLASAATATPVQVRADSCVPALSNTGVSLVNGQMQLGVFAYTVGQPIQTKSLTIPLVPTFVADSSGNGLVSVVPPSGATTLYPTSANGQVVLQQRITTSPQNLTQAWSLSCQNCDNPSIAYGCSVISLADTTKCVQAGTGVGQVALVTKCAGLEYGSQIFDMYVRTIA